MSITKRTPKCNVLHSTLRLQISFWGGRFPAILGSGIPIKFGNKYHSLLEDGKVSRAEGRRMVEAGSGMYNKDRKEKEAEFCCWSPKMGRK